ncbi:MAG TPA: hypothetical protein VEA69_20415 [Tepidisphaeraceae bacterium]|nr:hypothetical protein [Tepidisphaeraceae bacterium]
MSRLTPIALTVARAKRAGVASTTDPPADLGATEVALPVAVMPKRDVNAAMEVLAPFVRETAQRIHGRYFALKRQTAQDFVQMAPALIWSRIEHFADWYYQELPAEVRAEGARDGGKDFFAAWCYRELNFRYLDFGRAAKAEPKAQALGDAPDVADHRAPIDQPSVYDFALSPEQADALKGWDPLDGVILFCLAGHWSQVPPAVWEAWLDELGLGGPFPPAEFVDAPRPKKRLRLAEALHVSRDVIFQRWHRLKKKYLA